MLQSKSLVELRGIAQAYGIPDIFQKDNLQLIQAIELKQQGMAKPAPVEITKPVYDARLMTAEPAKISSKEEILGLLAPHITRGLHVTFSEEQWFMQYKRKTDEGTLRMPLRIVLRCAEKLMS